MARNIEELIAGLESGDASQRRRSAQELGIQGYAAAVPALVGCLSDVEVAVVEAACDALVAIGGRQSVAALLPLLHSDDAQVRNATVTILQQVGGDGLDLLLARLQDTNADIRKFAVDVLGYLDEPGIVEALIACLGDDDPNVAAAVAESLGRLGDARAVDPLVRAYGHSDIWVRCSAARSLGMLGGPAACEALLHGLGNEEGLALFATVGGAEELRDPASIPALVGLLGRPDASLYGAVIRALTAVTIHCESEGVPVSGFPPTPLENGDQIGRPTESGVALHGLIEAIGDRNPEMQIAAADLAGYWRVPDALPAVIALFYSENEDVRDAAVRAVQRIEPSDREALLRALADTGSPEAQRCAGDALSLLGAQEAVPQLLRMLQSAVADERRIAAQALEELRNEAAAPSLILRLDDADQEVSATAARALGRMRVRAAIPGLVALVRHGEREAREAAVEALARIGTMAVVEEAETLCVNGSDSERMAALQILSRLHGQNRNRPSCGLH